MVTKKGNEGSKETSLVPTVGEVGLAVKPQGLSDQQSKEIHSQADKVVKELVSAEGSEAMTIADQISNVGVKDQKRVSSGTALLQEKMGNIFYSDKKTAVTDDLTKNIGELQTALVRINPKDIQKEAKYRIIRIIPFFGGRIIEMLKVAANRRLTLQQFIDHLEDSLESGETMLRQDNAQLKVMFGDLETKQAVIGADAYYAEVLMEKLSEAMEVSGDEKKKNNIQKVLFRVSTRAQDLRAMENIHEQFFVSIEMTRDNNDMLIATVQRLLTMGMNVVYVSFAIHAALMRQKDVIEASRGTRDFIGNMIVSNATMINNHVKEIGDLYKEPIVAMEKLEKAVSELQEAIDATNRMKSESIERAKANVVRIRVLTEDLRTSSNALPDSNIKSLEAGEMLQLTAGKSS